MTTIATDGRSIAADGRMTAAGEIRTETHAKLRELPDGSWVGGAGDTNAIIAAVRELSLSLTERRDPVATEGDYTLLRLYPSGAILLYGTRLDAAVFVDAPFTIGSGGEFARGALAAGASLKKAMRIAATYNWGTGPLNQYVTPTRPS